MTPATSAFAPIPRAGARTGLTLALPCARYLGHKRIDFPVVNTSTAMSGGGSVVPVARVRFSVLRALAEPVFMRSITLRLKQAPWGAHSASWGAEAQRRADEAAAGLFELEAPRALAELSEAGEAGEAGEPL